MELPSNKRHILNRPSPLEPRMKSVPKLLEKFSTKGTGDGGDAVGRRGWSQSASPIDSSSLTAESWRKAALWGQTPGEVGTLWLLKGTAEPANTCFAKRDEGARYGYLGSRREGGRKDEGAPLRGAGGAASCVPRPRPSWVGSGESFAAAVPAPPGLCRAPPGDVALLEERSEFKVAP